VALVAGLNGLSFLIFNGYYWLLIIQWHLEYWAPPLFGTKQKGLTNILFIEHINNMNTRDHFSKVATHYNKLATNGLYATLAPHNKGGRKSEYINAVFDAAVLDRLPLRSTGRILDFGDNDSFDFVVARESLCYMPDEQLSTALGEIHRVLKPDGRFLWLEQVSDSPRWQRHLSAPNLVKRPLSLLYLKLKLAGFHVQYSAVVRSPRFPWIYPVWFGLLPKRSIPKLAALEVAWHRRFNTLTKRWWNQLIVAEKKSTSNPHETTKSQ